MPLQRGIEFLSIPSRGTDLGRIVTPGMKQITMLNCLIATIDEDNSNVNQELEQKNRCAWFSNCSNEGETEDSETSSNSQSNRCTVSDCSNGDDGSTRICQGPRTVDFDENGEITDPGRPVRNG